MNPKKIVVATDFSECSRPALELAFSLARNPDAKLNLVHVVELPPEAQAGFGGVSLAERLVVETDTRLEELVSEYSGGMEVQKVIRRGRPSSEILAVAKDLQADLLVLGTHGRSGLARLLIGSTAESVLRHAPCQVLVVKAGIE